MTRLRTSLFWKLMLAFTFVVLAVVGSVALIARQTTTSELYRLRQREGASSNSELAQRLSDYYAATGSWESVSSFLEGGRGGGRGGRGAGPPLRLTDAEGRVVLNTVDGQVGQRLSAGELAQGEPLTVEGNKVGTLFLGGVGAVSLSEADREFLAQVQTALIVGALIAIGFAVIVGFFLFLEITAPLRRLTRAAAQVATGDLSIRVPVSQGAGDEINQLALAFNQMTADLAQADKLRRDMTADIAHELRTPLTVIQGNLEAVLDGVYPADDEHLEPVLRKTQLLRRLVDDLRTLALADAGELVLHLNPMDLRGLVKRTVGDFLAQARVAGVELSCELQTSPPPVLADAARVEQVIGILLDNALHHTPAGGQITVDLRGVGGESWLSVRDSGAGIPSDAMPHVFERFYRAQPDRNRAGGSGLGLAIAQAIVTAHGGRIWAESEKGEGTTVTVALPAKSG